MQLGPTKNGLFVPIQVRSIEIKRQSASVALQGQSCTLAIRIVQKKNKTGITALRRDIMKKGMVLLGIDDLPLAVYEFEAQVEVLRHSTTISTGYQPVVHCGVIRQSATILSIETNIHATSTSTSIQGQGQGESTEEQEQTQQQEQQDEDEDENRSILRSGETARVRFRFCYTKEYLTPGNRFLFREGTSRGIGKVIRVFETEASEEEGGDGGESKVASIAERKRNSKRKKWENRRR